MPRPKSFERLRVLDSAMDVFWSHGFASTSIHDLSAATGLQPGSIYAAFGSKRGIFLEVIDHYFQTVLHQIITTLAESGPALPLLRTCLTRVSERMLTSVLPVGCLMTNTSAEDIVRDPQVAERIGTYIQQLDDAFYDILCRAQRQEELRAGCDPRGLAHLLMTVIIGKNILTRTSVATTLIPANIDSLIALMTR